VNRKFSRRIVTWTLVGMVVIVAIVQFVGSR
jgi:hypothetical protein